MACGACSAVTSSVVVPSVLSRSARPFWPAPQPELVRVSVGTRSRPSGPNRFPERLDDVTVRVAALDAHVARLVPLLDELDAVRHEQITQRQHRRAVRQRNAEVHPVWPRDRLVRRPERERESVRVVEHQDAVVVPPRRPCAEAEVRLVEAPRPLLVGHRDGEVVHRSGSNVGREVLAGEGGAAGDEAGGAAPVGRPLPRFVVGAAGVRASPVPTNSSASVTDIASTSLMSRPPKWYSSTEAWNRLPPQSSHGVATVSMN